MKNYLLLFVIAVTLYACSGYSNGPADMKYQIHLDKEGTAIATGDFLSVHFIHRTEEDSLLYSSYTKGRPVYFDQQKPFFKGDIFTGLAMLSEGDSATFKLNFDSMQTILNVSKPPGTRGHYLLFTVKVEKVIPRKGMNEAAFQQEISRFIKVDTLKTIQPGQAAPHR